MNNPKNVNTTTDIITKITLNTNRVNATTENCPNVSKQIN